MKAPIGMRPLSFLQADIDQWVMDNTDGLVEERTLRCNQCNAIIEQTTLYATVHINPPGGCAGYGEVTKLALPYCPTCEPDMPAEAQRTCAHEEVS